MPDAGSNSTNALSLLSQFADLPSMKQTTSPFSNVQLSPTDILKHHTGMKYPTTSGEQFAPQKLPHHCLSKSFNFLPPDATALGVSSMLRRDFPTSGADFENAVSALLLSEKNT